MKNINKQKQSGAVLVISLLILSVITMISAMGMKTATIEEKLASNVRDRTIAFQSAERGLVLAEAWVTNPLRTLADFDGTSGKLGLNDSEPDYYLDATWVGVQTTAAIQMDADGNHMVTPQFTAKHMGTYDPNPPALEPGQVQTGQINPVQIFKVVVRSQGLSPNSEVTLVSYVGNSNI